MKSKSNSTKSEKKVAENKTTVTSKHKKTHQNPWIQWVVLGVIVVLTVIVFYPMLQNQFTSWDDPAYITRNPKIWKLSAENIKYIFTQPIAINYHPFTMISLALNYSSSGLNPHSYYLTNLILHLFNIFFVFGFVYVLSRKNIYITLFTTLIFAIHPMHVESVAWAAERKDVLYTFFFIPALTSYLLYIDTRKQVYNLIALLLSICAMLSKPAAIIFPLAIIALEYFRNEKFDLKAQLNKIPFVIVSAFFMYMTLVAQTMNNSVIGEFKIHSVTERFFYACNGFMIYLIKFFVPYQLSTFHPYPNEMGPLVMLSPLLILALVGAIYYFKEYRKLLVFGLLFYLVNLILVLQFFSIGEAAFAERYTYVPYIIVCFVIGTILFGEKQKLNRNIALAIVVGFGAGMAFAAQQRVNVWHNDETLWTDLIAKYPDCDRGFFNRGSFYLEKGNNEKALSDFNKAIELKPNYRTFSNRGQTFLNLKKYKEALSDFSAAIELKSNQEKGYLGRAYANNNLNKKAEAIQDFGSAIEINPTVAEAYIGRAYDLVDLGKYEEALKDANKSIELKPCTETYSLLASVHVGMQKYDEAINDYKNAATYTKDASVYGDIGNIYYNQKQFPKAIEYYSIVLNQNPKNANTLYNRGAAYYMNNQFKEAITDLENCSALEPNSSRNYSLLSTIYRKSGNNAKADAYAEQAKRSQ